MAFTRDEMTAYEAQPQKMVEIVNPFAETSPPAASKPVETPPAEPVTTETAANPEDSSTSGESAPTASGDGTSGEETAATPAADATPDGEAEPPAEPPRKGSAQERIQELVDERNALRKYGDHMSTAVRTLTEEIERLMKGATPTTETTVRAPAALADDSEDPAPSLNDADVGLDEAKFAKKNAAWIKRQIAKGIKQGVAEVTTQQTAQQAQEAFQARAAAFEETHKDFRTVIGNPALPQLAPEAAKVIARTEEGISILYYLGKNVDVATRIAKLPEAQQLMRLGEIKAELSRAAPPPAATSSKAPVTGAKSVKPKNLTQAPPPPTPTPAGSRSQPRDITDPSLSMDEFVKQERERKIADRAAKRAARGLR
jgi:hypothetical protein